MRTKPVFSVSLCRAAALCPRLFWFGWIGGTTLLHEPNKTKTMGRVFHEAMDGLFHMLQSYELNQGKLPDEQACLSLAYDKVLAPILERRVGWNDQGEMLSNLWDSFQHGVKMVHKYLGYAAEKVEVGQIASATLLQGEHEVEAATRRTGGAGLSGRIDAIIFDHRRGLPLILEYKTGERKWRQADIVQVSLYRWMLREARGVVAEPVICYFTPQLEEQFFDHEDLNKPPFLDPTAILHEMEKWLKWEEGQEPLPPPCGPSLCFKCPHQKTCAEIFGPVEGGPQWQAS